MIKQWIIHLEYHLGYRFIFTIKRKPKHGDVVDGGRLIACQLCSGDGMLLEET